MSENLGGVRIASVVGTRPNFIKIAPFIAELKRRGIFKHYLIHAGQHFSYNMSDFFIEDLVIDRIDYHIHYGDGSQLEIMGRMMMALEEVLKEIRPELVVVVGDVNSTLAGALVAARMKLKLAHIESGLRSFVMTMPEEQNRLIVDHLSDILFAHSDEACENLLNEGICKERIFNVGNIVIDTLVANRSRWQSSTILEYLNLKRNKYAVCTLHRAENVDNPVKFERLLEILIEVANLIKVVFPIHPRSFKRVGEYRLERIFRLVEGLIIVDPLGYLDFMKLVENAAFVLTDSGGVQEETTFLGIPCLTLRNETERPVTIRLGTNVLVSDNQELIMNFVEDIINGRFKKGMVPPLWDGQTSKRIVDIIASFFN